MGCVVIVPPEVLGGKVLIRCRNVLARRVFTFQGSIAALQIMALSSPEKRGKGSSEEPFCIALSRAEALSGKSTVVSGAWDVPKRQGYKEGTVGTGEGSGAAAAFSCFWSSHYPSSILTRDLGALKGNMLVTIFILLAPCLARGISHTGSWLGAISRIRDVSPVL